MAGGYTIRVEGIRELRSALKQAEGDLKGFRGEMKRVAEPVLQEALSRGSRYQGIGKYKSSVRGTRVAVEQSKGKVTGLRGDFGSLQIRTVLDPALESRQDEVVNILEDVIDDLIQRAGL